MSAAVLYVYAIARDAVSPDVEAIDQSRNFGSVQLHGVTAIFTPVSREAFDQEVIDRRSADLEWLGSIGYRHQAAVNDLMRSTAVIPLRAFTLFSSEEVLRAYLEENRERLRKLLERLDGKREWTLQVEFEPQAWSDALVRRIDSLRTLSSEIETASSGKAFLLKKKLEDGKKKASQDAEQQLVSEIERLVLEKLSCDTVSESRQKREGAFPQINVLLNRDEESRLQELHNEMAERYRGDGVTLALTGPWPPYTFAALEHA